MLFFKFIHFKPRIILNHGSLSDHIILLTFLLRMSIERRPLALLLNKLPIASYQVKLSNTVGYDM
jgi:hypothetical protein